MRLSKKYGVNPEERKNPYYTGGWVVVSEDYIKRAVSSPSLQEHLLKKRAGFVPDAVWQMIGLPYGEKYPGDEGYGPLG